MKLVTSSQMRNIDKKTIEGIGIPGLELMEKAGRGTALVAKEMLGDPQNKVVIIFCGRGNNGGDGFVVGRHLSQWGAQVEFLLTAKRNEIKGDAKTNLEKAVDLDLPIVEIAKKEEIPSRIKAHLIVDALFGTGFVGEIKGYLKDIIERINSSGIPILSVDIPSGLHADTGGFTGPCVKANRTVTMALPKIGHFFFPGKEMSGKVSVVDIGVPPHVVEEESINLNLITEEEVREMIPKRPGDAYKGSCGRVVLIAGSTGMTGAASLASLSCLRAGAGMAILGTPKTLNPILETKLTEVMTKPLPDVRKKGALALRGLGEIRELLKWGDCCAIGPGLGQHFETIELIRRLISKSKMPAVIDADGLNALAKDASALKECKAPLILTPHIGELSRLNGVPASEIAKDRIKYASDFAKEYNCVLVFKGAPTIISEPDGQTYLNPTGNAGMASAGSGDVLTGIIVGLLAQMSMLNKDQNIKKIMLNSACAGVFIHGLTGDLAKEEKGEMGMIAKDMMEKISEALIKIVNG
ncbi:MAG: NAD(P)H-hydrate dehydratase [candidate division Zixibacteria bacterium]|nr:NAD(P)H-hydrate dehydratase [candidate division Zixibacteria bacterium]